MSVTVNTEGFSIEVRSDLGYTGRRSDGEIMRPLSLLLFLVGCPDPKPDTDPPVDDSGTTGFASWTLVGSDEEAGYLSISGTSGSDVWVVGADGGEGGTILHYDGSAWTDIPSGQFYDLWWVHAFPGGPVYVVGSGATILRGDTSGFTRQQGADVLANLTLYGIWGSSPNDIYAVGGYAGRWGFVWHSTDGQTWTAVELPDDLPLTDEGELPGFFKVWGSSASDVWVVGTHGTVLHYDGAAWSVVPSGTTELLFTVHGNVDTVAIVGTNTVLTGDIGGLTDVTPDGAGILQGVTVRDDGTITASGASGSLWTRGTDGAWIQEINASGVAPESLHAVWTDPDGGRWAVGGGVLTPALNAGVILHDGAIGADPWVAPPDPDPPEPSCPAGEEDPFPTGSIARRWNEQILNSIRRDIPRPGVHARNLFHLSVAMWDAWAAFDDTADGYLSTERFAVPIDEVDSWREIAISYAAYRVLSHRYASQSGGPTSVACYDAFMAELDLDPTDTHTDGDDAIAVGNRIGALVISTFADDGANEANNYADTTGWSSVNDPLVVDQPGVQLNDPSMFQLLNLATAETQNGIILDSGLQSYIGAQWGLVEPFAMDKDQGEALYHDPGPGPDAYSAEMKAWVTDLLTRDLWLDHADGVMIDISPGAYGDNALGADDGDGHAINGVTGQPYAANVVPRGDFARVLAEFWADGPRSETPPGHWNVLANDVSDAIPADDLRAFGEGDPLDRLAWDVHLYLALNGALHDAAITAWGTKRELTASRPISLIRWMAMNGQSSDPSLPSYHQDGLPLIDGVDELITAESSAPGQRHHHLRWFVGEVAVYTWRGEPGDRSAQTGGLGWIRAKEWIPYQRRTFVTPAFPGFISGHSTFSRAAAEVLAAFTGSPWFPGGLGEASFTANTYLVFEDGPSVDVDLQWGTYYDAADQAGQSRIYGGIHILPDDYVGRTLGSAVGIDAAGYARQWYDGTAR